MQEIVFEDSSLRPVPEAMVEHSYTDLEISMLWKVIKNEKMFLFLDSVKNTDSEKLKKLLYNIGWHDYGAYIGGYIAKLARHIFWLIYKDPAYILPLKIYDEELEVRLVAKWRLMVGK